ncbi:MAG: hypothetical protein FJ161_03075 [Gammaproteobacteria bacterium]|nr:hypothetical protein [Gammaproteobacteria bacterium]
MRAQTHSQEIVCTINKFFPFHDENPQDLVQKIQDWNQWIESQPIGPLTNIPVKWKRFLALAALGIQEEEWIAIDGIVSRLWPFQQPMMQEHQLIIIHHILTHHEVSEITVQDLNLRNQLNSLIQEYRSLYESDQIASLCANIWAQGSIRQGVNLLNMFLIGAAHHLSDFNIQQLLANKYPIGPDLPFTTENLKLVKKYAYAVLPERDYKMYLSVFRFYTASRTLLERELSAQLPNIIMDELTQLSEIITHPEIHFDLIAFINLALRVKTRDENMIFDPISYLTHILLTRSNIETLDFYYNSLLSSIDSNTGQLNLSKEYIITLLIYAPFLSPDYAADVISKNQSLFDEILQDPIKMQKIIKTCCDRNKTDFFRFFVRNQIEFVSEDSLVLIVCSQNRDMIDILLENPQKIRLNDKQLVKILDNIYHKFSIKYLDYVYRKFLPVLSLTGKPRGDLYLLELNLMIKVNSNMPYESVYTVEDYIEALSIIKNSYYVSRNLLQFYLTPEAPVHDVFNNIMKDIFSAERDIAQEEQIADLVRNFLTNTRGSNRFLSLIKSLDLDVRLEILNHYYTKTITQELLDILNDHHTSDLIPLSSLFQKEQFLMLILTALLSSHGVNNIRQYRWRADRSYFLFINRLVEEMPLLSAEQILLITQSNETHAILLSFMQYHKNKDNPDLKNYFTTHLQEIIGFLALSDFRSYSKPIQQICVDIFITEFLDPLSDELINYFDGNMFHANMIVKNIYDIASQSDNHIEIIKKYFSDVLERNLIIHSVMDDNYVFRSVLWHPMILILVDKLLNQIHSKTDLENSTRCLKQIINQLDYNQLDHAKVTGLWLYNVYPYANPDVQAKMKQYAWRNYNKIITSFADFDCRLPDNVSPEEWSCSVQDLCDDSASLFAQYLSQGTFENDRPKAIIKFLLNIDEATLRAIFRSSPNMSIYLFDHFIKVLPVEEIPSIVENYKVFVQELLLQLSSHVEYSNLPERATLVKAYCDIYRDSLSAEKRDFIYFAPFIQEENGKMTINQKSIQDFFETCGEERIKSDLVFQEFLQKYKNDLIALTRGSSCFLSRPLREVIFQVQYGRVDEVLINSNILYKSGPSNRLSLDKQVIDVLHQIVSLAQSISPEELNTLWSSGLIIPRTALMLSIMTNQIDITKNAITYMRANPCNFQCFYLAIQNPNISDEMLATLLENRPKRDTVLEYILLSILAGGNALGIFRLLDYGNVDLTEKMAMRLLTGLVVERSGVKNPICCDASYNIISLSMFYDRVDILEIALARLSQSPEFNQIVKDMYFEGLDRASAQSIKLILEQYKNVLPIEVVQQGSMYLLYSSFNYEYLISSYWMRKHPEILEKIKQTLIVLFESGVDINLFVKKKTTLLLHMIDMQHIPMIEFLLEHGANPYLGEWDSKNAMEFAQEKGIPLESLIQQHSRAHTQPRALLTAGSREHQNPQSPHNQY